ncbi:MAG: sulfur reduction protein DsrJ [Gammaproteobacteria bacterium]|nr:sulfur reduction protein DsrJ [Gammaproteobacteria bacterium]
MTKCFLRISLILTGLIMLFPTQGIAETPFPTIHEPEGHGVECVEDEDEMRRNHMNYILHQRDKTMHEGIRTETYSLSRCIDCHVQPNDKGEVVGHDDKEHFCNACHQYAAVQIDCFQCHADRPQKYIKRASKPQALKEQLQEVLAAKDMGDAQ